MSVAELVLDVVRLGIRLEVNGDRLRYHPRSAMTPNMLGRMKAHKTSLLAILRHGSDSDTPAIDVTNATEVWQRALGLLKGQFPPDRMKVLRAVDTRWADELPGGELARKPTVDPLGPDGWPSDCVDPDELTPCPNCGKLELWQSVAGDLFGLSPGRWRCTKCDPPALPRRLGRR